MKETPFIARVSIARVEEDHAVPIRSQNIEHFVVMI